MFFKGCLKNLDNKRKLLNYIYGNNTNKTKIYLAEDMRRYEKEMSKDYLKVLKNNKYRFMCKKSI